MREPRPQSQSLKARGLSKVTVLVPEASAQGLRQFARELCRRQETGATPMARQWRRLSPSAELMVDPERGLRCANRDTGATGSGRYHWTVAVFGILTRWHRGARSSPRRLDHAQKGRSSPIRKAAASSVGVARLTDRRLARLYWRLLDTLDYWLTRAQLWRGVQTLHRKPTLISRGQAIRGVEDDYDRWRLHGPTVPAMPCA